jgi:hypothetical protein
MAVHVVLALLALGVGLLWHLSYTQSVALMVVRPRGESYGVIGVYSAGGRLSLNVSRRTHDPRMYPWLAAGERPPVAGRVTVQVDEPRHPGAFPLLNGSLRHFAGFGGVWVGTRLGHADDRGSEPVSVSAGVPLHGVVPASADYRAAGDRAAAAGLASSEPGASPASWALPGLRV